MKLRKKIASMLTAMVCTASICTGGYGSMIGDAVTADTYEDSESTIKGDFSGNGELDLQDAILIAQFLSTKSLSYSNVKYSTSDEQLIGDYNGDGKCNLYDMLGICKELIENPAVPSDVLNTFVEVPGAGISVGSADVKAGSGTITLPLSLEGDLTSNGCIISVKYDDGLTFNYLDGSIVSNNDTPGEVKAAFVDPTGLEKDFASLEFSCPDTAGTYNVDVTVYALDYDGNYVANPVEVGGTITVTEEEKLLGDVSGNGELELQDAILIGKYLARTYTADSHFLQIGDYNGDGKCNLYDMLGICKKLIGAPAVPSDSCNTFADVPGAGISVGSASADVGSGTITLPLSLEGDLTSNGCIISVKFDDGLTFNNFSNVTVSDSKTPGEVKAAFVDPTGLDTNFSWIELNCPDTAGTYNVDVTVYALDYDGGYVANPVEVGGTITVTAEEPAGLLSYEKIDEDYDGIYDGIRITDCDESAAEVKIPAEIEGLPVYTIGYDAFWNCPNLKSIEVSENNDYYSSVDGILFNKSKTCLIKYPAAKTDSEYDIPDNVDSIGDCAFFDCTNLTSIEVSENNTYFSSVDGVLFNKERTSLIKYPAAKTDSEYDIPDGVDYIRGYAFESCLNLKNVTLPDSLIRLEYADFAKCSSLESIIIPDSVIGIGNIAFKDCTSLKSITIPDGISGTGYEVFAGCSSLTNVTIPDSFETIEWGLFYNCTSLTDVTIPESVTMIMNAAFSGCTSLRDITIENPECEIDDDEDTINDTATIHGYANSTAQTYAETYGRNFVSIGEYTPAIIQGDISGNGKIDLYDAIEICKSIMGMRSFTDEEKAIADYDGNGKVDLYDAIGIAKKLLEK